MFTMAKIRNGSTYLGKHLTANDYYSKKESVSGEWVGQAAERLGLAGSSIGAKDEAFERLRQNEHPLTGRRLTARTGTDRIVFLDFQCSAPKSVSMLAVTFGDERLRTAHQEAVTVAFSELEQFAARRVRAGDASWSEQTAATGNLCAARFEHDASRALDAQLHTHLVTANATFDAKANRWFALTERQMLAAIRYAGKVYQNELACRVLAAGYEIESTRNARGVIEGFEIAGITAEERARASTRRAQIAQEIAAFE
ncbi:MAG: MobF family relaxase, partial [Pseudolabrys sp.]|nr:MobF family relaxase [Pseudolabrys sp.]